MCVCVCVCVCVYVQVHTQKNVVANRKLLTQSRPLLPPTHLSILQCKAQQNNGEAVDEHEGGDSCPWQDLEKGPESVSEQEHAQGGEDAAIGDFGDGDFCVWHQLSGVRARGGLHGL